MRKLNDGEYRLKQNTNRKLKSAAWNHCQYVFDPFTSSTVAIKCNYCDTLWTAEYGVNPVGDHIIGSHNIELHPSDS